METEIIPKEINYAPRKVERHLFLQWCAMPRKLRVPKTQQEFSKKYGVSEQSLCKWKNDEDFYTELKLYRQRRVIDELPDVLESVVKNVVKTGDARGAKFLAEYAGDFVEKKEVLHKGGLAILLKQIGNDREPLVRQTQ